jgi:hypothetical protein
MWSEITFDSYWSKMSPDLHANILNRLTVQRTIGVNKIMRMVTGDIVEYNRCCMFRYGQ